MPRPTSIAQFPSQWLGIINAVSMQNREIRLSHYEGKPVSKPLASRFRFMFYAFRTLLRKDPMQQDTAMLADMVECTIEPGDEPNACVVVFRSRDNNAIARALDAALGGPQNDPR